MQNYKIEALWDCIYCGNKAIKGGNSTCPFCGHTRGKEVRFYLPQNIGIENAVDESKTKISQGPDWMCSYCRSYNSSDRSRCNNCGAEREKGNLDYINVQTRKNNLNQ